MISVGADKLCVFAADAPVRAAFGMQSVAVGRQFRQQRMRRGQVVVQSLKALGGGGESPSVGGFAGPLGAVREVADGGFVGRSQVAQVVVVGHAVV